MCTLVNESLDEAEDNMKFLDGIKKQVEICVVATDFSLIRTAIKKVMKSLRYAWMLSKYYNTDEKESLKSWLFSFYSVIDGYEWVQYSAYRIVRHWTALTEMSVTHVTLLSFYPIVAVTPLWAIS